MTTPLETIRAYNTKPARRTPSWCVVRNNDTIAAHVANARKGVGRAGKEHVGGLLRGEGTRGLGREFDNLDEAVNAAAQPWPEGIAQIEKLERLLDKSVVERPRDIRRRRRWSETDGESVDIDRLRSGTPYWEEMKRNSVPQPAPITLLVECSGAWNKNPEALFWRGAAAIILADRLESAGWRVEVKVAWPSTRGFADGCDYLPITTVKAADSPLDKASLATAVSAWFYRIFTFLSFHAEGRTPCKHYGSYHDNMMERLKDSWKEPGRSFVVSGFFEAYEAAQFVRNTIKAVGIDE